MPGSRWYHAATEVTGAEGDAYVEGAVPRNCLLSGNDIVVNRDMTVRGVNGPEFTSLDPKDTSPRRIFAVETG